MSIELLILIIATLAGLYMASNIGANDLANAMGTSVGSGAITLRQAVLLSIIANTLGAVLAGGYVTDTIAKGMIDPTLFKGHPNTLLLGMFSALISAGVWVNIATIFGLPVSTTHAIVGAVVGFGMISVGIDPINWGKVIKIVLSWVISPVSGAIIGGGMYYFVEKRIILREHPEIEAEYYSPLLISLVCIVLILSFIFKGLKNLHLKVSFFHVLIFSAPFAILFGILGKRWIRWYLHKKDFSGTRHGAMTPLNRFFAQLQILTACYVAFAHGANDVANAVGPLAAIFSVVKTKSVALKVEVPIWMLFIGGIAIGGGLFVFGKRVIETIGKNITEITPVRGFCAEFGAATTILACSRLGLPVSTTHVLVGSVVGVGIMRGMGSLDLRILRNIVLSWIITLPFTVVISIILYKLFLILF